MNQGYAAFVARGECLPHSWQNQELGDEDVLLDITHCGICHSDIHLIDDDWGMSSYPLVPGHEVVGVIRAVGPAVDPTRIGSRAGVGWQCGSCGSCRSCRKGRENHCARSRATCVGRPGGFARMLVAHQNFAFPIPDAIDSAHAAPLFCAGATVYTPFRVHGIGPAMRVGILGLGGLGHLALQFAHAHGAEVFAFTTSRDKQEEAKRFGASQCLSYDLQQLIPLANSFDFLLSTVSADLPWDAILGLLAPEGKLVVVGASPKPMQIHAFSLIGGARTVSGSAIGSPSQIIEMLELCARTGIRPQIETLPFSQVNQALQATRSGAARYRMVLEN